MESSPTSRRALDRAGVLAGVASCGDISGQMLGGQLKRTRALPPEDRLRWLAAVRAGQAVYVALVLVVVAVLVPLVLTGAGAVQVAAAAGVLSVLALTPLGCLLALRRTPL